eukprot:35498-Prymnesium_polylepis.1
MGHRGHRRVTACEPCVRLRAREPWSGGVTEGSQELGFNADVRKCPVGHRGHRGRHKGHRYNKRVTSKLPYKNMGHRGSQSNLGSQGGHSFEGSQGSRP